MLEHFLIYILLIILIIILSYDIYIRFLKCKSHFNEIISLLNQNMIFLKNIEKKSSINDLKNNIKLRSYVEILQKISKSDYVSLFKYDKSIEPKLHFLFSLDKKGSIVQSSLLNSPNIIEDIISKSKVKVEDYLKELRLYDADYTSSVVMKDKYINKIYYQNILSKDNEPSGLIVFSYKDIDYILSDGDKFEIYRIIEDIIKLL